MRLYGISEKPIAKLHAFVSLIIFKYASYSNKGIKEVK